MAKPVPSLANQKLDTNIASNSGAQAKLAGLDHGRDWSLEAKNKLSALLERVEHGEEILITRRTKPIAKLVPATSARNRAAAREAANRILERSKSKRCAIYSLRLANQAPWCDHSGASKSQTRCRPRRVEGDRSILPRRLDCRSCNDGDRHRSRMRSARSEYDAAMVENSSRQSTVCEVASAGGTIPCGLLRRRTRRTLAGSEGTLSQPPGRRFRAQSSASPRRRCQHCKPARLVSRVKRARSALMQTVTVERPSPDGPAFLHPSPGANAGSLLLRVQNTAAAHRHQARDREAVSADDVLLSGLDFSNTARKCLVRFTKTDGLAHVRIHICRAGNVAR
jgi:prevent-host-death family protein